MATMTLPKNAYSELIKRQERMDSLVAKLQKQVNGLLRDEGEELRPEVAARLDRQSKLMDEGKGRRFKSMKEFHAYMQSL